MLPDDRVIPSFRNKDDLYRCFSKNVLAGFPRCGNTALRLFLEKYTGRPSGRPKIINTMSIGTDIRSSVLFKKADHSKFTGKPIVTKIHNFWEVDLLYEDKIIYILRDYKDAIVSILKYDNEIFAEWFQNQSYNNDNYGFSSYHDFLDVLIDMSYNYGEQLKQFHFIPLEKLLVYYEDFVTYFEKVAKEILEFMGIEVDVEKIRRCNIVNEKGREETDVHFHDIGRDNKQINIGNTNFIGEYHGVLKERELKLLRTLFKKQLGKKLYKQYLGRYE